MNSYLITDPAFYGTTTEALKANLSSVILRHHPDFICFRDKQSSDYAALAAAFLQVCKEHGSTKALLHSDWKLAARLGACGVHLTSQQFEQIEAAKKAGLYVVVSTHSEGEILLAEKKGADAVTYSPVFPSPGKGNPLGLEDLKERVAKIAINIFALGGIVTPAQVNEVERTGCYGFASIRYFIDN